MAQPISLRAKMPKRQEEPRFMPAWQRNLGIADDLRFVLDEMDVELDGWGSRPGVFFEHKRLVLPLGVSRERPFAIVPPLIAATIYGDEWAKSLFPINVAGFASPDMITYILTEKYEVVVTRYREAIGLLTFVDLLLEKVREVIPKK